MAVVVAQHQGESTGQPTTKVLGATGGSAIGAAVATLINWGLQSILPAGQPPPQVRDAIVVIVSAGISFLGGWIMRPAPGQTVIREDTKYKTAVKV